ncbi:MAG: hypothetical protein H0W86_03580, partial [Armatimonadetes bacterium]|nr:hypothetical protein [Armatimonadota bacterium]
MERLIPGTPLGEAATDDEALAIVANLALAIREEDTAGCMPIAEYIASDDPLGRKLLASTEHEVFLHGDLHQFNVLRHGERWVLIDPK